MVLASSLTKQSQILIVGGGTWGCSTALHLAHVPDNKGDDEEAIWQSLTYAQAQGWLHDPVFKPYYHDTGYVISASTRNAIRKIIKGFYKSKGSGWVHARKAMTAAFEESKRLGVKFITGSPQGEVQSLIFEDGDLKGANTADGKEHRADRTILAVGASAERFLDFENQIRPTAWTIGHIQMTPEETQLYKNLPVLFNIGKGFFMEPDEDLHQLKMCDEHPGYVNWVQKPGAKFPRSIPFAKHQVPLESEHLVASGDRGIGYKHITSIGNFISDRLGSMGLPMATNLQKHLSSTRAPNLIYFNRTISRGDSLKGIGAQPASSATDLVDNSDIIFMSLSDDSALESTLNTILDSEDSGNLAGKLIVDTSTVHPDSSAKAETRIQEKGGQFIASPVFGASPVAAQGKLLWIIAGPNASVDKVTPYVEGVMGRAVIRVGEDIRASGKMKTAGNFITAGFMEIIAEAHVLAEKSGLGSGNLEALIEQQYGPLPFSMSQRLTTGAYMPARGVRPWSDLNLAIKDVGHGIALAEQSGTKLEVAEVAIKHLKDAKKFSDSEQRPLDSSSMYGILRKEAGLPFETELVKDRDAKDGK
ncbi:hypothetical protein HYE67_006409 [Fusarium culmorum]|uniref:Oxidoreductase YfjR n=1 Tax=Fusarium culmorum TaxID=5516 RepID=A0A7S8HWV1_FUSCU|nr:hypothetical protein HYE67_006409 [Fusarium culmorum]